jgi:hypothetical protein
LVGNLFSKKLNTTHKETLNLRERRSYSISNQEHQLTMSLSEELIVIRLFDCVWTRLIKLPYSSTINC